MCGRRIEKRRVRLLIMSELEGMERKRCWLACYRWVSRELELASVAPKKFIQTGVFN